MWKKIRLFLYKKLLKGEIKVGMHLCKIGNTKDRINVMGRLSKRLKDSIFDEYPDDKELRELKLTLIGYSLGISIIVARDFKIFDHMEESEN